MVVAATAAKHEHCACLSFDAGRSATQILPCDMWDSNTEGELWQLHRLIGWHAPTCMLSDWLADICTVIYMDMYYCQKSTFADCVQQKSKRMDAFTRKSSGNKFQCDLHVARWSHFADSFVITVVPKCRSSS